MSYSLPVSLSSSSNAPLPISETSNSSPRTLNGSPVSVETNQSHDCKKIFDSATSESPIQKGFPKDPSMSSKAVVSLSNPENNSDNEDLSIEHFPYGAFENEKDNVSISSIMSFDFPEESPVLETGNLSSFLGGLSFHEEPRNLLSPIPKVDFDDIPLDSSFQLDDAITQFSIDALTKNESSDLE